MEWLCKTQKKTNKHRIIIYYSQKQKRNTCILNFEFDVLEENKTAETIFNFLYYIEHSNKKKPK